MNLLALITIIIDMFKGIMLKLSGFLERFSIECRK